MSADDKKLVEDGFDPAFVRPPVRVKFKINGSESKWFLDLAPRTTVQEVRAILCEKCSLELQKTRLLYGGFILADSETLEGRSFASGHTILAFGPKFMRSFSRWQYGEWISLSEDGLTAIFTGGEDDLGGGLVGDAPIAITDDGLYFEVRIDKVSSNNPDGLAIGVVAKSESILDAAGNYDRVRHLPETLDLLEGTWLVGFDGQMWDSSVGDFMDVEWSPASLQPGDRVGVLVEAASGDMSIFLNGRWCAQGPRSIPRQVPLYAAVDLIGNTDGITLLPAVRRPAPSAEDA